MFLFCFVFIDLTSEDMEKVWHLCLDFWGVVICLLALTQLHSLPAWYMCYNSADLLLVFEAPAHVCFWTVHTIFLSEKYPYLGSTFSLWLTLHFLDRSWLKFWAPLESFPVHFSSMLSSDCVSPLVFKLLDCKAMCPFPCSSG